MKLADFVNLTRHLPWFGPDVLRSLPGSYRTLMNQIPRWVNAGKLIRLRRGLYTVPDRQRDIGISRETLANAIYPPSYISLQYAVARYDLIPEGVEEITSVSPRKTSGFQNPFGRFTYRNVKTEAFFGAVRMEDDFGHPYWMATPEKAILDLLYFEGSRATDPAYLTDALRLQHLDLLRPDVLEADARRFDQARMVKVARRLNELGALIV